MTGHEKALRIQLASVEVRLRGPVEPVLRATLQRRAEELRARIEDAKLNPEPETATPVLDAIEAAVQKQRARQLDVQRSNREAFERDRR